MKASALSQYIHSRGFAALLTAIAVTGAVVAYSCGNTIPISGDKGLALPSANHWISSRFLSLAISLGLSLTVAMMTVYINRVYNVLRSMTMLFAGIFFIMQAATPSLMNQLYGGIIACTVLIVCALILFSLYGRPDSTRRVFLMFFLASLTSLCQYTLLFYIPMLLIGCIQMRVLNLRSFLAAMTGCVTPLWIFIGFGIITPADLRCPDFISYFAMMTNREIAPIAATTAVTMIIGTFFTLLNLMKILTYNSRTRAYNGFFSLLLFATILLIIFDFVDLAVYIPLLNCCAAFQVGHFFTLRRGRRSYIGIFAIILIYIALYLWNVTSSG